MSELSRLRWLCRRGMKELDVVVTAYLEQHYASASRAEQAQFRKLLEMADPDLHGLLLGREPAGDAETRHLLERLRNLSKTQ